MSHVPRTDPRIKLLFCNESKLHCSITQRDVLAISGQRNLRCLLISDVRIEGRYEHQRIVEMFFHPFLVRLDPNSAAVAERAGRVSEELGRRQDIVQDDGLVYVQLKVTL